jgi:hypothetical protein
MPVNPVFTDPNNSLLKDRLARISERLRTIVLSTSDEYQAEVYSTVNAVLTNGIAMTPLQAIGASTPAIIGDLTNNYTTLNNDADDIANEILRIENSAADLFNLAATSQNQLRQQIREFIYSSNPQVYNEEFLNATHISEPTATLDFNAGVATCTLIDEAVLTPVFSIGPTSSGVIDASGSLDNLVDGRVDTAFIWKGTTLELILTFTTPQIMNRITLNMDTYAGLELDTFTTSPDGTLIEDVLNDLNVDRIIMDGTSNKFSGDVIIDFPPRHVKTARLIITDRVGTGTISFREFACSSRRYTPTGQLTSTVINAPTGTVVFTSTQNVFSPYVSITHQISYNGTQFTAINPGDVITLISIPYYYRAILERNASRFNPQNPLVQSPLDPIASPDYVLTSSTSTPRGNGIIERTLQIDSVVGPIIIRDNILPNTLIIQEGSVILGINTGDYSFTNNTVSFPVAVTGLTVSYQTSSLGASAIADREEYYTPLLYSISFIKE